MAKKEFILFISLLISFILQLKFTNLATLILITIILALNSIFIYYPREKIKLKNTTAIILFLLKIEALCFFIIFVGLQLQYYFNNVGYYYGNKFMYFFFINVVIYFICYLIRSLQIRKYNNKIY